MSKSTTRRRKNGNNNQVLEAKLPEQKEKEDVLVEQLDFEIECPRCGDVAELFSEFDHLSYYCGSCRLELDIH
jgi:uncharacterized protein (DUF983 family)